MINMMEQGLKFFGIKNKLFKYFIIALAFFGCSDENREKASVVDRSLCKEAENHLSVCLNESVMTIGDCNEEVAASVLNMSCEDLLVASEDLKEDGVSLLDRLHCNLGVLHFCQVAECKEEVEFNACIDFLDSEGCAQCGYYSCLEEKVSCGDEGYLIDFVGKYCNRFTSVTYDRLSVFGKVWMDSVRECLIYNLDKDYYDGESCESIEKRGIEDHIECYVNSGICSLPIKDWFNIMSTIAPQDFPFMQAISVGNSCINNLFIKE